MENWCWNIREIKKTGQGLSEELGKYIWLAKADTSQEAPASKSGSSSLSYGEVPYFDFLGKKITIGLFYVIIILVLYIFSPFYFKNFYFEPRKKAINQFYQIQEWNGAKIKSKVFYNQGIKLEEFCDEYRSKKRFLKNEESKYSQNEICQENAESDINVDKVTFNKVFSAIYYSKNRNDMDKDLKEAIYYVEH